MEQQNLSRRDTLKTLGVLGAATLINRPAIALPTVESPEKLQTSDIRRQIFKKVWQTQFIDTHEHLPDEQDCLQEAGVKTQDDWSVILRHYLDNDLISAGMAKEKYSQFFSKNVSPREKWKILEPFWQATKNTGYGQAVRIAIRELYGVSDLSENTVEKVQTEFQKTRKPGFYNKILRGLANIDSCQVNTGTFKESRQPLLLMQDLSIVGMFAGPNLDAFGKPTGIKINSLADWHKVIDWWFNKYSKYAVAVKSQNAYSRNIDYEKIPAERAEPLFSKVLAGEKLSPQDRKALEDHLFWYAVNKATEHNLPVKLHTGYYVGNNNMPLSRLINNPGAACDLCKNSPQTKFVFMHICYPYYEELISVAKHYSNAYVDMCWSWIINPIAAKDFLKKFIVAAPSNKIFTFGGDYIVVEPVLGHALIARQGIATALSELVEEGWLGLDDALNLIDPIMRQNAIAVFNIEEKKKNLRYAPWFKE
jgi:predicted TIM-barrel fold metal-dependent hydrolase